MYDPDMIIGIVTDDYGNTVRAYTSKYLGQWLVSTNTYGGYDLYHCVMKDAEI